MAHRAVVKLRTDRFVLPPVVRPGREKGLEDAEERGFAAFVAREGGFAGGYWEGDPGELTLKNYPVDEFCVLLEGEITITAESGDPLTMVAGDAFIIPRGFNGTWKISVRARKLFACAGEPRAVSAITGLTGAAPRST